MTDVNWELIIFIIIAGLIIFAAMGIFIGMRISSDKRRIRELEDELSETRKTLEAYRSKVNTHFKKTSELFTQLTNSYKAIYMHLAEGSQELCTTDAALLKPANAEFLKVAHEEKKEAGVEPERKQAVEKPAPAAGNEMGCSAAESGTMQQREENEKPEHEDAGPDTLQHSQQEGPEQKKEGAVEEGGQNVQTAETAAVPPDPEKKEI